MKETLLSFNNGQFKVVYSGVLGNRNLVAQTLQTLYSTDLGRAAVQTALTQVEGGTLTISDTNDIQTSYNQSEATINFNRNSLEKTRIIVNDGSLVSLDLVSTFFHEIVHAIQNADVSNLPKHTRDILFEKPATELTNLFRKTHQGVDGQKLRDFSQRNNEPTDQPSVPNGIGNVATTIADPEARGEFVRAIEDHMPNEYWQNFKKFFGFETTSKGPLSLDTGASGIQFPEEVPEEFNTSGPSLKPIETLCFGAGTSIDMADGTQKPIEQIEIGDEVMA
ncbi:MAG: hypothetical protein GKS01_19340 [Alphaproteobacteria bacterium]|nr:hypothetical protein [Alphaproteobacteria bacterium]